MFYLVYKITNTINNKTYIGVHQTKDIDDGYMGSGVGLKLAYKKYGINKFKKEILKECSSSKEMFEMEASLVNESFVKNKNTYNQKVGGFGGFDHLNTRDSEHIARSSKGGKIAIVKMRETVAAKVKEDPEYAEFIRFKCRNSFKGKSHTDETKRLIGENSKIKQAGKRNSQFGTMWITNQKLSLNKKIKKEELASYEKKGWIKGRKSYK